MRFGKSERFVADSVMEIENFVSGFRFSEWRMPVRRPALERDAQSFERAGRAMSTRQVGTARRLFPAAHETFAPGVDGGLRAIRQVKFAEYVADVRLDRLLADEQALADGGI